MAPGRKVLRYVQLGKETTSGTAVAATAIWRGSGSALSDDRTVERVDEMVGLVNTNRTNIPAFDASLELSETPLTFQQFPYIMAMSFGGNVTGVQDGGGSDYIYTATLPTTAAPTPVTYTVETGDDFENEEAEYTYCDEFTVKGEAGKPVMVSAKLQARQVTRSTKTAGLSLITVEDALTSKGTLYYDAVGGTIGTTAVANQILAFEVTYKSMYTKKWTMDAALYWTFPQWVGTEVTGKITYEHSTAVSGSGGVKADWRAQTPKLMQIKIAGSAVQTPGTTYSVKTLLLNLPMKWQKVNVLSDKDGNSIVDAEFFGAYDSTAATGGSIICVNESTALA